VSDRPATLLADSAAATTLESNDTLTAKIAPATQHTRYTREINIAVRLLIVIGRISFFHFPDTSLPDSPGFRQED
jgi:hypothetical protein